MKPTFIIGAGGLGREVLWLIREINARSTNQNGYEVAGFVDDNRKFHGNKICGVPVLGPIDLLKTHSEANAVFGIGLPRVKQKIWSRVKNWSLCWPSLIAPDVEQSEYVEFDRGVVICSGSILTTQITIGAFSLINLDCTVGHDAVVGTGVTMSPGVHVSGKVSIGSWSNIGTGSVAIPGVCIGEEAVVGAGSVVIEDIPSKTTAVGNPAKVIKTHEKKSGEQSGAES